MFAKTNIHFILEIKSPPFRLKLKVLWKNILDLIRSDNINATKYL